MMDLKKVVGQLIITDISSPDTENYRHEYEKLIGYNVGGLMLFNGLNIGQFPLKLENQMVSYEQTKQLIKKLKSYDPGLFIAVDVEGGLVDRLHHIRGIRYSSAKDVGRVVKDSGDAWAYNTFSLQGDYLRSLGFNMNAAPVLDVVPSYKEKYIMAYQKRSFSSDPKLVSKAGLACIKAMQNSKIVPIAKHFPGIGSVLKRFDPHIDFPKIRKVTKKSLEPFLDAVDNGVDVIMTTHLKVKKYGKKIATMNEDLVNTLRDYGFSGIVITDDISLMSTGMLNRKREQGPTKENIQSIVDTGYEALKAGHDMVLMRQLGCVNNPETNFLKMVIDKVEEGILSKDISEEKILGSYRKVLELKKKYL